MFKKTAQAEGPQTESHNITTQEPHELQDITSEAPSGLDAPISEEAPSDENWPEKYSLLQDQYTRLAADFDNYRKRTREEQETLVKYGAQKSVVELLPVLDNLERATASLNENSDPKVLFKSFDLMHKQLTEGLAAIGVQRIQAVGQPFDPLYHEAVNRMESAEFPENVVMYEAQSGYLLHDKVIRPAMVVVSTGGSAVTKETPAEAALESSENPENETSEDELRNNPFRR